MAAQFARHLSGSLLRRLVRRQRSSRMGLCHLSRGKKEYTKQRTFRNSRGLRWRGRKSKEGPRGGLLDKRRNTDTRLHRQYVRHRRTPRHGTYQLAGRFPRVPGDRIDSCGQRTMGTRIRRHRGQRGSRLGPTLCALLYYYKA